MKQVTGARATIERAQQLTNKLFGYPSRGANVGGGVHVSISDDPGHGWTMRYGNVEAHPTLRDLYAHPMGDEVVSADDAALSAAERTELAALVAARVERDATWDAELEVIVR